MLEKLIGAQILSVDNNYIEVKKGDEVFKLEIISDDGGCCGYADFTTNLLYSPNDLRNPVITNVAREDGKVDYQDSSTITFFGESKPLATIESNAGSGSGWGYGAFVSLHCRALDIDETLASW
ncbi:hypothetical protein [Shouchella clausii]|uniref:hypothetical protein n=1 Tax=Shouchella clausii TaxID=79880 RepID=UPI001C73BED9|nr:hypothetical protein [Shouchella clausii]MBX0320106.1 hypothetical protein [Shouchella clausii]